MSRIRNTDFIAAEFNFAFPAVRLFYALGEIPCSKSQNCAFATPSIILYKVLIWISVWDPDSDESGSGTRKALKYEFFFQFSLFGYHLDLPGSGF
jgi:hypothetical protein